MTDDAMKEREAVEEIVDRLSEFRKRYLRTRGLSGLALLLDDSKALILFQKREIEHLKEGR